MASSGGKFDSVFDFTEKGLVELKSWMRPWWLADFPRDVPPSPTGDTIDAILGGLDPDGWWKLNEPSGTIAHDSSGNGLDMTADVGFAPIWAQPAGPPGQQTANFQYPGGTPPHNNARVSRIWAPMTGDFTAGIWFSPNPPDPITYSMLMGQGNPTRFGGSGWLMDVNNTDQKLYGNVKGVGSIIAANPILASTWIFAAVTHNTAAHEWKLYQNGLLEGSLATGTYAPVVSWPLWIGHDGDDPSGMGYGYFACNGRLSYAFLIPSTLSGAQLLDIYNSAALPSGANEGKTLIATGLGATYWDFASSGHGTTANRPTLTANGGTLLVGTAFFDTTLGKPIWWDGSVWRDAAGTAV